MISRDDFNGCSYAPRRRGPFQHDPDLAFVTLIGKTEFHGSASELRSRWKRAYEIYFPAKSDRANAVFVEVEVERMELWIRGVTPEPFGLRATVHARARRRGRLSRRCIMTRAGEIMIP